MWEKVYSREACSSECGEVTEVYSRITGYYRPVKNWNDGKAQEYKERKVYNPEKFDGKTPSKVATAEEKHEETTCKAEADKLMLFATSTCPNCKMAAHFLEKAGIEFEKVMADANPELAKQFGVLQAPTLVRVADGNVEKIVNLSNIKAFVENN